MISGQEKHLLNMVKATVFELRLKSLRSFVLISLRQILGIDPETGIVVQGANLKIAGFCTWCQVISWVIVDDKFQIAVVKSLIELEFPPVNSLGMEFQIYNFII